MACSVIHMCKLMLSHYSSEYHCISTGLYLDAYAAHQFSWSEGIPSRRMVPKFCMLYRSCCYVEHQCIETSMYWNISVMKRQCIETSVYWNISVMKHQCNETSVYWNISVLKHQCNETSVCLNMSVLKHQCIETWVYWNISVLKHQCISNNAAHLVIHGV